MNFQTWFKKIKNTFVFSKKTKKTSNDLSVRIEGVEVEDLPWWGTFQIAEEQSHYSKMGQTIVCIDHFNQGWHLASYRENDTLQKKTKVLDAYLDQDIITLKPALPDRTILFKLDYPLFIPPKTELSLYASSPLLIRIEIGTPPLFWEEVPTETLPDTWRGKSTQEGELCYAAGTPASLRLDPLQIDTVHAITPISISNKTGDGIFLKEVHVPAPFLSIYADIHQQLWTEQVKLFFEETEQCDTLITQNAPNEAKEPSLISVSRIQVKAGFKKLFRTLRGN